MLGFHTLGTLEGDRDHKSLVQIPLTQYCAPHASEQFKEWMSAQYITFPQVSNTNNVRQCIRHNNPPNSMFQVPQTKGDQLKVLAMNLAAISPPTRSKEYTQLGHRVTSSMEKGIYNLTHDQLLIGSNSQVSWLLYMGVAVFGLHLTCF